APAATPAPAPPFAIPALTTLAVAALALLAVEGSLTLVTLVLVVATFAARTRLTALAALAALLQERLAREPDAARVVDVDAFDEELLALFELVANVADVVVGDLRDVQEAVRSGQNLDERAKVGDSLDRAEVGLADLGRRRESLDDRAGLRRGVAVR